MSTSTVTPASTSTSGTTSPFTPITLGGISKYASDFQNILNRAVQIAQIPITQLQNEDANVLSEETLLGTLNTSVGTLATSLSTLGTLAAGQSLNATSSDPTSVTAAVTGATSPATYTINSISSIATAASERSLTSYSDSSSTSVSATGTMQLVVGSQKTTFNLTTNTLVGLRDQINSMGAGVTASILTTSSGNYLSLTANGSGATTLQLNDDPSGANNDILTTTTSTVVGETTTGLASATTTPVSTTGQLSLTVGTKTYALTLTDNSLTGLENQINASGADVTASIVTDSSGNSHLSLATNTPGETTLSLNDDPTGANTSLLTNTPQQGTNAVFQLNGIQLSQANNVVNSVAPGVTFTLEAPTTTPVTVTLATDPTQLSSALQSFVTDFNETKSEVVAQTGPSGGLLSGDLAVTQIGDMLRQITGYSLGTGTVQSLSDLGITFDNSGQLNFDQSTFNSLSQTQIADALTYLGSPTSGLGGFSAQLTEFSDPVTGLIQLEQSGLSTTDQDIQAHITTLTTNLTAMQTAMSTQLNAADAAVEDLTNQQSELTASLQGLSLVLYGQNPSTPA